MEVKQKTKKQTNENRNTPDPPPSSGARPYEEQTKYAVIRVFTH